MSTTSWRVACRNRDHAVGALECRGAADHRAQLVTSTRRRFEDAVRSRSWTVTTYGWGMSSGTLDQGMWLRSTCKSRTSSGKAEWSQARVSRPS